MLFQTHAETAILRQAFFRNIKTGHQLEALGQRAANALVRHGLGLQHAIHPHPYLQPGFLRLDVHVRRTHLHGVFKQRLQQTHHGCALQADGGGEFTEVNRVTQVFFQRPRQATDLLGAPIEPVKRQCQLAFRHRRNGNRALEQTGQLIKGK